MNISTKIKGLLKMHGKKNAELVDYLGLARTQSLNTKFTRGSFSAGDLIRIASFVGCELAFILSDGQKINLVMSDIIQETKPEQTSDS